MKYGQYYHVYNHANGGDDLFVEESNYIYFLRSVSLFLSPVADVCVYCLMPNHFHLLVRIKKETALKKSVRDYQKHLKSSGKRAFPDERFFRLLNNPQLFVRQQFSNLFNSYSQAYNKFHKRRGSLFRKNYKRKEVTDKLYLKQLVLYIHNNPVHHEFCAHPGEWAFSSYKEYINNENGIASKHPIFNAFKGKKNLISQHKHWRNRYKMDEF